jgi:branched-chain amino acid transport system permease protein
MVVAVLICLPPFLWSNRLLYLAAIWMIYALAAQGLGFLYYRAGQLSIAHAALWGLGAYVAGLLNIRFNVSYWEALPIACLAAGATAAVIGYPSLRIQGHYFVISTFAFGEFLRLVGNSWSSLTYGTQGLLLFAKIPGFGLFDFTSPIQVYYLSLALFLLTLLAIAMIMKSRWGPRLNAVRENEDLARSLGINTGVTKVLAFGFSGVVAGAAGATYLYLQLYVEPDLFATPASLLFVVIVVLGGGGLFGALFGAAAWVFVPEFIGLQPEDSQIAFGCLLAILILQPWRRLDAPARGWVLGHAPTFVKASVGWLDRSRVS